MSIHAAITVARGHREELIFGALTGLLSSIDVPLSVHLPRGAGSTEPQFATHFGQTLPQDTPALLHLLDRLEEGVDERGEFNQATAQLLYCLGADFRRHGLATQHYGPLSEGIIRSIERHIPGTEGVAALKEAVELACHILAHGAAEAQQADARVTDEANPPTTRATVLEVERRNSTMVVVRMHMDPPLKFSIGEPLMARIPQSPMMWRPVYSSLPASPEGLIEVHLSCGPDMDATADNNTKTFLRTVIEHTQPGDEWVLSPQPLTETGVHRGLHIDSTELDIDNDRDVVIIAQATGLAPARAAIMQQVMGGKLGASPATRAEDVRPNGVAPAMRRVHLFWGAHNPGQLYELQGLMGLAKAFDWLHFTPVVEQFVTPPGTNPSSAAGLPDAEKDTHATNAVLTKGEVVSEALYIARNLHEKVILLCGSPEMVTRATEELTQNCHVPRERIATLPVVPCTAC